MKNMSKSARIALGIVCFILMFGIGLGIFYLVDTPKFNQLFGISSAQPAEPDKPDIPDEPAESDEPKNEITDFILVDNVVWNYYGDEEVLPYIPESYSYEESYSYTQEYASFDLFLEDLSNKSFESKNVLPFFQTFKIKSESGIEFKAKGGYVLNEAYLYETDNLFPATIDFYDTTYYEGTDYYVDTLGDYFAESKLRQIDVPNFITACMPNSFQGGSVEEVIIYYDQDVLSCSVNIEHNESINYYVPDNLYENYKNSASFSRENVYKMSDYGMIPQGELIEDYYFYNGMVTRCTDNSPFIEVPASYSVGQSELVETIEATTMSEMLNEALLINYDYASVVFQKDDFTFTFDSYLSLYETFNSIYDEILLDTLFPCSLSFYKTTFYEGDDYQVTELYTHAFRDNWSVEEIKLPDSIYHIYDDAFKNCTSLKRVFLPASLSSVGSNIFANCPSLEEIYIANGSYIVFNDIAENLENGVVIYMPDYLYTDYTSLYPDYVNQFIVV